MPLTARDIALFARDCVAADSQAAADEASRLRRLDQAARVARSFLAAAEAGVRASGYRVTPRVRDGLWAELCRIETAAVENAGMSGHGRKPARDERESGI